MATDSKNYLSVDLGKNGGRFTFNNYDELMQWLSNEENFYSWLNNVRGQHQNAGFIADHFFSHLASIKNLLAVLPSISDETQRQNYLEQIHAHISSYYNNFLLIHSSTSSATYIRKLVDKDPVIAAHALGFLVGATGNVSYWTSKSLEGFLDGWGFQNGFKSLKSEKDSLDNLRERFQENIDEIGILRKRLLSNVGKFESATTAENERQVLIFQNQVEKSQGDLDQFIKESNERLANIEDAYDKHMSLQASVEYWTTRSSHHKIEGRKYARLAGLTALLGAVLIFFLSYWLLNTETLKLNEGSKFSITDIPLWHISIIVFTTSLFIWAERILVRLLLSNLHLETDAGERVVMAKTYVAMLREGQAPKDDDRKLILASLFRPNVTGIINDDGMPFNLDAMQKIIGGK